jgi:hypothetical protein
MTDLSAQAATLASRAMAANFYQIHYAGGIGQNNQFIGPKSSNGCC